MRHLGKRFSAILRSYIDGASSATIRRDYRTSVSHINSDVYRWAHHFPGGSPSGPLWSKMQLRYARFTGGDVRPGNVIERRGKLFEVVKAQHTTQGRGGAIIQVELRDVDNGSKVNERLRTDEPVEKIYVREKSFSYLYTDDETGNIVLMEPETYTQLEVPSHLFGESVVFLQDDMKVTVQLYDERPLSVSIPNRVMCTVTEAAQTIKGSGPTPYKRVLLDNGVIVQVPAHVTAGDKIFINTTDRSYIGRA